MDNVDLTQLRALHEAAGNAVRDVPWERSPEEIAQDVALRDAFPALADRLDAAERERDELRAEVLKLAWAWNEVQSDNAAEASDKASLINASVVCLNSLVWLADRDARQQALGAAEAFEMVAAQASLRADHGVAAYAEQQAARLRREAEGE